MIDSHPMPCIHCTYDLRTQTRVEQCPECGADVEETYQAAELEQDNWKNDRELLRKLGMCVCIAAALIAAINILCVTLLTTEFDPEVGGLFIAIWFVAAVMAFSVIVGHVMHRRRFDGYVGWLLLTLFASIAACVLNFFQLVRYYAGV